jgi:hypothetical protein
MDSEHRHLSRQLSLLLRPLMALVLFMECEYSNVIQTSDECSIVSENAPPFVAAGCIMI